MIGNDWDEKLKNVWNSPGFNMFFENILNLYQSKEVFPSLENVFNALKLTPYSKVKVVIVGQDPYHGQGEAHGLSFSVLNGTKLPPSLKNIYQELNSDLNIKPSLNGDLTCWAKEGVLLLNSVLTVEKDKPASHQKLGWQKLTDYIIKILNTKEEPIVFILWGNFARSKKELITSSHHLIIESVHPSPFSARNGFFGSKPFSKTNIFLKKHNIDEIDWSIKS